MTMYDYDNDRNAITTGQTKGRIAAAHGRFSRFAGLTTVTDRLTDTDRPRYSVCNNRPHARIYVRSTAMRPQNT